MNPEHKHIGGDMRKTYLIVFLAVILCSCAAPQEKKLTEEFWNFSRPVLFTPANMLSEDYEVKARALLDYTALEDDSKKKVITYLAYMLADERDVLVRHNILDLLRDIKAGPFVIAPLVRAYGGAKAAEMRVEISHFIREYRPSMAELPQLVKLLEEKDWDTRIKAISIISSMKSKAGSALPEIIQVMQKTGQSYGIYGECYDLAEKINSEAMLAAAALDLAGPKPEIRESALRKIYEVYTDEQTKPADRQMAFKSIARVLYTGDEPLAVLASRMLEKTGFEEAKAKTAEFEAYKNMKVESMKALAAEKMDKKFSEELENMYLTLKLYYIKQGRADAVITIFDPSKKMKKP